MKIITVKMRLSVALLVTVFSSIKNSSPNLDSDEEVFDQCTIHASEYDQTTLDAAEGKYNSKGRLDHQKCFPYLSEIVLTKGFRTLYVEIMNFIYFIASSITS